MEVYSNENEQVDAVRRFFTHNGKALAVGVIIGLVALGGWRYWSSKQESSSQTLSAEYQQLVSAMRDDRPATLDAVARFASEHQDTYGALAALDVAKRYVDADRLDKAAALLSSGLKNTKDAGLQAIISLRLARVQLQQHQADMALKTLDNVKSDGWTALAADIRGEALLAKGDKQGAREAWSKGIASDSSPALKQMMQMKMNNLS